MAKKKVTPRQHGRRRLTQPTAAAGIAERNAAVLAFDRAFRLKLPIHAGSDQSAFRYGSYVQVEGDEYDGKPYGIPDGTYRVQGSDWLFRFEGGGFVEANLATAANEWGGKDAISIAG